MLLAFGAAAAVFIAVVALALLVMERSVASGLAERRLVNIGQRPAPASWLEGTDLLRRNPSSSLPFLRRLLSGTQRGDNAMTDLQQAGIRLKVGEYYLLRLLVGFLFAIIVLFFAGTTLLGLALTALAALIGYMAPRFYVHLAKGRRRRAISSQMVETLQLIANALRSGFAFAQAVELAAGQLTPPIRDELNALLRDLSLGARMDDALNSLAQRTGSLDIELMVTTVSIQRTTGGNLSEVLDNVAATISERERLYGEVRALTAQQRLTGLVLSIYPLGLALLLTLIAPSIMKSLWQESLGRWLLAIAAVLQGLGAFTIQRVLRIDV
jgi:tight adherence protein B